MSIGGSIGPANGKTVQGCQGHGPVVENAGGYLAFIERGREAVDEVALERFFGRNVVEGAAAAKALGLGKGTGKQQAQARQPCETVGFQHTKKGKGEWEKLKRAIEAAFGNDQRIRPLIFAQLRFERTRNNVDYGIKTSYYHLAQRGRTGQIVRSV